MKVLLTHPDRELDPDLAVPSNAEALVQDLGLPALFDAMARGDGSIHEVVVRVVLAGLREPEEIRYRQQVLEDCLAHPAVAREIHAVAVEAVEGERRGYFTLYRGASPGTILSRCVNLLTQFTALLDRLRTIADEHAAEFRSPGFTRFFAMIGEELSDGYLEQLDEHLRELRFRGGVLLSASLGMGNKGRDIVLRRPDVRGGRLSQVLGTRRRGGYSFQIPDRDENGSRALADLRNEGINLVANAVAQSTDHILGFFRELRTELAFYVGCLNLHETLAERGAAVAVPDALPAGDDRLHAADLRDASLVVTLDGPVAACDVEADGRRLVLITGANRGGKSTFLRSIGQAQLMMQCGMFVTAGRFAADVRDGVFTHFKREEDATMEHGKLDEELARMRVIAGMATPRSMLLCNESFASTNEREGSEIGRQVVRAMLDDGVKVFLVTHLHDLADGFRRDPPAPSLFLRAERLADGRRTFRMVEGEPLPTSHGADLFATIFGSGLPGGSN